VLAHARLLHTDSDAAAFVFLAVACLVLAPRAKISWKGPIATAIFLGLALLAKFSSLALVVIFPALAAFWFLALSRVRPNTGDDVQARFGDGIREGGDCGDFRRKLIRVGLAVLVVVPLLTLILYRGHVVWYFKGLSMVLEHSGRGHPAYLLGEWSNDGWWYYFPVALAVKTPIPLLVLAVAGIVCMVRTLCEPRSIVGMMFVIVFGLWLAGAMSSSVNLGLRHILPAYVLLFVFAGCAVHSWSGKRAGQVIVICLLIWTAVSSYRTFPDYIAYFNEFAGGPDGGSRYLVGSNLDWGQEFISLERYMEDEGIPEIAIYTMGAPVVDVYGIKRLRLKDARPTPQDPVYFAMGATFRARLAGEEHPEREQIESFLSDSEEVTTLGYSLTVYRVRRPFPEALMRRTE
jgi:hypothetical protein